MMVLRKPEELWPEDARGFAEGSIVNTGTTKLKFVWVYAPQLKSHRI